MKKLVCILTLVVAGFSFIQATSRYFVKPKPVEFVSPAGWPQPVYDLSENPLTEEGIALGLKLFYDTRLSIDGTFSCASCHQQFAAFATFDHPLSHGVNNTFTTRNAPGLFNLAWKNSFMHDGGVVHLDAQPLAPLTASNEMGETIPGVINKLQADTAYRRLFKSAFQDDNITTQKMTKALSQFMLTLVSNNSKYDKVMRGEAEFTRIEKAGYKLFKEKNCVSCHAEPFFTDFSYRNTGLQPDSFLKDYGRVAISGNPEDSMKFMVPSLRNIRVTAPYGHDGRFYSVTDAIDHYRSKVHYGPHTDSLVKNKISMTNDEIFQIRTFLFALTDTSFLKDTRFAVPNARVTVSDHH